MAIRSALKQLPDKSNVKASRDPTMLFSGLVWGKNIYVDKGLMVALWPLKTALFQHGDRLIESLINHTGLEGFKDHFIHHESDRCFYLFDEQQIIDSGAQLDHKGMKEGYEQCSLILQNKFPNKYNDILNHWIIATNKAIRSVFFLDEWNAALKNLDASEMWRVVCEEEEAKNVAVVCEIIKAGRVVSPSFSYSGDPIDLIRASSRWFTLIDDYLDLEEDDKGGQPNYLIALLHQQDEWQQWKSCKSFPKTLEKYKTLLSDARNDFKKNFPVLPSLFTWWIEREAKKKGKSPF